MLTLDISLQHICCSLLIKHTGCHLSTGKIEIFWFMEFLVFGSYLKCRNCYKIALHLVGKA